MSETMVLTAMVGSYVLMGLGLLRYSLSSSRASLIPVKVRARR